MNCEDPGKQDVGRQSCDSPPGGGGIHGAGSPELLQDHVLLVNFPGATEES